MVKNLGVAILRVEEAKAECHEAQDKLKMFLDHNHNSSSNSNNNGKQGSTERGDSNEIKCYQIAGMISIKDMLLELTTQQVLPKINIFNINIY